MKLKPDFYLRKPLKVARDLIGKELVHVIGKNRVSGKIVEVEAYGGEGDEACHSLGGRKTARNKLLFGKGGFIYIYLIYGMYYCFNVVVSKENIPGAVFIRAVEPVEGVDLMVRNRGLKNLNSKNIVILTNGPGKLCQAMGFDKSCYGVDLCGDRIFINDAKPVTEEAVEYTPRINVDYAGKAKNYPWRIILKGNRFLSRKD